MRKRTVSAADVREVCGRLEQKYGSPRHGNPVGPLDDLIYIMLSNRTSPTVTRRTFDALWEIVQGDWNSLGTMDDDVLHIILKPAGLATKRLSQLRGILERLSLDFGSAELAPLSAWTDTDAERYLTTLPGVSLKVAKCVLMYTFDRKLLPVDVHVHRLTSRLGWHRHRRSDQCHQTLEALVPPDLRYGLHVNAIAHGRATCRPEPTCETCVLSNICRHPRKPRPRHRGPERVTLHVPLQSISFPAPGD